MKYAIALLLAAALPLHAQPPSQFRASAPVEVSGKDALHEVELPFEVFRDARRDLADVRIFNAKGDAVPMAWAGVPPPQLESSPPIELPFFPISTLEAVPGAGAPEVTVRAADGTLVFLKGKQAAATAKSKPRAYLLDASKATERLRGLVFDWQAAPGSEVVNVAVESSDDLKTWSAVGAGSLVRLENSGRTLAQPRIEFAPLKAKYFRVTWNTPTFTLNAVRAENERRGVAPKRHALSVPGKAGSQAGDFTYDLGARLPVETLRLVPAETNSVLSTAIYTREKADDPWRLFATASFYRLQRDGAEVQSPPIEIGRRAARHWLVRLAAGSSAGAPPSMEIGWRGVSVIFVAQGEGPFHVAFGNAQATSSALTLDQLVPTTPTAMNIGTAKVGAVRAGPPPTRWEQIVGEMNPRRIALWTILVTGVAGLGFMAWRLAKAK